MCRGFSVFIGEKQSKDEIDNNDINELEIISSSFYKIIARCFGSTTQTDGGKDDRKIYSQDDGQNNGKNSGENSDKPDSFSSKEKIPSKDKTIVSPSSIFVSFNSKKQRRSPPWRAFFTPSIKKNKLICKLLFNPFNKSLATTIFAPNKKWEYKSIWCSSTLLSPVRG